MLKSSTLRHLAWIALVVAAVAAGKPAPVPRDVALKPTSEQAQAALVATRFLTRFHYRAEPLDAAMSRKIFDRYFDSLDADRLFFVQADVDRFTPDRDKLGDDIYDENLSVPFAIFNLYEQRVSERTAYARSLLKKGFDFDKNETYTYQREHAPWAKTTAELDELWRKRVKNDWLRLQLAGKDAAKIRETLDKRYSNYLDRIRQIDAEDVFQTFMNAYAMSIDPHTNYLGPRQAQNFDIAMKLSLEGIGAVLQAQDDYTAIREIVPGGPAALSGKFKVGDRIVGVGQGVSGAITDVVGWRLDDVVDLIRGPKDTTVRVEVLPADAGPDAKHELVALVRKKVNIEEQAAKSSVIDVTVGGTARRVGIITLPTFYEDFDARRRGDKNYKSATHDVARLLAGLKAQQVDAVLMDLRNNGGGSLSEAIDLTGLFVGKGPVVQVRNTDGRVEVGRNTRENMVWNGPFAVLVNRNSASASEIFAGAIQDYGRGLIIGEQTYGKGTVQNLVDLDQMSQSEKPTFGELKMTIQQFFRVDGASTQLHGVTPDIAFPVTGDFAQNGESTFQNALPFASIAAADYAPNGDLKSIVPMLKALHDARVAKEKPWLAYEADVADARRLRADTSISLNEKVRVAERDAREKTRKERHPELAQANAAATGEIRSTADADGINAASAKRAHVDEAKPVLALDQTKATPKPAADPNQDDGLQADERSIAQDVADEKARKAERDVVLNEAAHILADEVNLLRGDTQLAARVLPHAAIEKPMD
ncbi:MAG: carboxy terminal-processing peptidase [Proteobacteria bacterium]|nr:carboxy terminal-processing peptidase [Pseudomonadota bacterium]